MMIEALIKKLEETKEGSEELDREIHEALGWESIPPYKLGIRRFKERWTRDEKTIMFVPKYTTSIDEALTTFPEGWGWMYTLAQPGRRDGILLAEARAEIHHTFSSGGTYVQGLAATMPLAICGASLKAWIRSNDT